MKMVSFEKNGKMIHIPWIIVRNLSKMRGFYHLKDHNIYFDEDVNRIIFYKCNIEYKLSFALSDHQILEFSECNFLHSTILVKGGNLEINDSCFHLTSLITTDSEKVSLIFNKEDAELEKLSISSKDFYLFGNFNVFDSATIWSKNFEVAESEIYTSTIALSATNLDIKNVILHSVYYAKYDYQNLSMQDVLFMVDSGTITFTDSCRNTITYHAPCEVTDIDILDEKKQKAYALLSILKGYAKVMNSVNANEAEKIKTNIHNHYAPKIEDIDREQEKLNRMKEKLLEREKNCTENAIEGLNHRKIKTMVYPKK